MLVGEKKRRVSCFSGKLFSSLIPFHRVGVCWFCIQVAAHSHVCILENIALENLQICSEEDKDENYNRRKVMKQRIV